jgi:hypothetical protein
MDDRLSFEVSAEITDPRWRVTHEAYDKCVLVVLGTAGREAKEGNVMQLWFREPATVVDLGNKLVTAGMRLTAQLAGALPAAEDTGEPAASGASEEYPVLEQNPAAEESSSDGMSDRE